jgi:hypothetical protein
VLAHLMLSGAAVVQEAPDLQSEIGRAGDAAPGQAHNEGADRPALSGEVTTRCGDGSDGFRMRPIDGMVELPGPGRPRHVRTASVHVSPGRFIQATPGLCHRC